MFWKKSPKVLADSHNSCTFVRRLIDKILALMKIAFDIPNNLFARCKSITIKINSNSAIIVEYTLADGSEPDGKDDGDEPTSIPTLGEYVSILENRLNKQGKLRLAETYGNTYRSFMLCRNGQDLPLDQLNHLVVDDYESYLRRNDLKLNTISYYLKRLRAIYNKAIKEYGFIDSKPFANSFTKTVTTAKRAISVKDIKKITSAETMSEEESLARDLFLFSYYTRGMSFIDIAYLKKSDIRDGYLIYKRKKTGQELRVAWCTCMQRIVDRHPSLDGEHLLGIIDNKLSASLRQQYHYRQCRVNQKLQRFAKRIGLPMKVTMYCARHSWATIAKEKGIPVSVISQSMGHHSEKTTQIYLKSISAKEIDRYNNILIKAVA